MHMIRRSFIPVIIGLAMIQSVWHAPVASAANAADFRAGRIIDDQIFFNGNAMGVQEIQGFISAQVPTCDTNGDRPYFGTYGGVTYNGNVLRRNLDARFPAPYTCLKNYLENTQTHDNNIGRPTYAPAGGTAAAQIIYDEAQAYNINPKVLIVLLQKESSLVTDDWPWPTQYKTATGYGCPDTAACDSTYFGFYNQVHNAARQFRLYANSPSSYNYTIGMNTIKYSPTAGCPTAQVLIQNQATAGLYNYTPYVPNQAALNNLYGTGDSCSAYGNRNFWRIFTDWFGNTLLPNVITGPNGGTIYLNVNSYKIAVPQMAMLQDYGFNPGAITAVSQTTLDSIPTPDQASGVSPTLGYVIKSPSDTDADGGSIYLISVGKRYQFTTMQQLADFGYTTSNISYLPLSYVMSIQSGGMLSNFISTPTSAAFQVSGGTKRIIFDYQTYRSLNPSDSATPVSYYLADSYASGLPLTSREVMVRNAGGGIFLLSTNLYHLVTSDSYNCWGLSGSGAQTTPLYQLGQDNFAAPITSSGTLGCLVGDGQGGSLLLNMVNKLAVPSAYGIASPPSMSADLLSLANRLPSTASPLHQALKSNSSALVWFLQGGVKRPIPTYSNYLLLHLDGTTIDTLDGSAINAIPAAGVKLGSGQIVKTPDSSAVYIVTGDARSVFTTSDDFLGFGYAFSFVETYPAAILDQFYPYTSTNINRYLYNQINGTYFLIDRNKCYTMSTSLLGDYGQTAGALASNQSYNANIFTKLNLSACSPGSNYVKTPDSARVYFIKNGTKSVFNSWSSLMNQTNNVQPNIVNVAQSTLDGLTNGAAI